MPEGVHEWLVAFVGLRRWLPRPVPGRNYRPPPRRSDGSERRLEQRPRRRDCQVRCSALALALSISYAMS